MGWNELRPVGTKVLVRLHKKRATLGRFHIPDDYQRQQETGEVVAVGPRACRDIKAGDTIVFGKYNGVQLPPRDDDDGHEYWIMEADYDKRGNKLPANVFGHKYAPYLPEVYGVVEAEAGEDVSEACSSDVHRSMVRERGNGRCLR